jgi:UDP-3-O-[3-hydroxymyristoyl] glucosamine N-acyltransferase
MIERRLDELARELGGVVVGDPAVIVRGVAGIREAQPGDITFLANARYEAHLAATRASAVLVARTWTGRAAIPTLQVDNPYLAFQHAVRVFRPGPERAAPGVHPTAVVSPEAHVGPEVSIGPHCVVERGARLGARVVLGAGCYVGVDASLGDDTLLWPRVVVRDECVLGARCIVHPGAVIGGDGFGFAFDQGRYHKVPQVGNVVIGDDVEIGANACVDRATTDSTRIGDGTKIDNLVQLGHNVVVGRHCIIVAQVGVAGSTELEDHVTLGGQAGLVGHIRVGAGASVGAQSGVTKSVPAETVVTGYPAVPHPVWKRLYALLQRLPQLFQRTRELERRLDTIERREESVR